MLPGKNDIMTATERYKSNCSPSKSCFHIDTTTLNKIPQGNTHKAEQQIHEILTGDDLCPRNGKRCGKFIPIGWFCRFELS